MALLHYGDRIMALRHYGTLALLHYDTMSLRNSELQYQEYQWVPVGTSGYQEYQEDQDQISGATYISDFVFQVEPDKFPNPTCSWKQKQKRGGEDLENKKEALRKAKHRKNARARPVNKVYKKNRCFLT